MEDDKEMLPMGEQAIKPDYEKKIASLLDCGPADISVMFGKMSDALFSRAVDSIYREDLTANNVLEKAFDIELGLLDITCTPLQVICNLVDSCIVWTGKRGKGVPGKTKDGWEDACRAFELATGFEIMNKEEAYAGI